MGYNYLSLFILMFQVLHIGQWEFLQAGFRVILTIPHLLLGAFFMANKMWPHLTLPWPQPTIGLSFKVDLLIFYLITI